MEKSYREIFGVVQRDGKDGSGYWTRIGTAFENKDGSLNLRFDYMPASAETTIQVRDPLPKDEQPEGRPSRRSHARN